jgi:hypothetical protein
VVVLSHPAVSAWSYLSPSPRLAFDCTVQVTEAELLCQQQSYQDALSLATQCVSRIEQENGKESIRLIDPYIVIGLANAG